MEIVRVAVGKLESELGQRRLAAALQEAGLGGEVRAGLPRRPIKSRFMNEFPGTGYGLLAVWYPTKTGEIEAQRLCDALASFLDCRLWVLSLDQTFPGDVITLRERLSSTRVQNIHAQVGLDQTLVIFGAERRNQ